MSWKKGWRDSAQFESGVAVPKSASANLRDRVVTPERTKHYRNKYDDDYQAKLARVAADIESGVIDRLTMKIGRERYHMRDTRTRQAQIELAGRGLLLKHGRLYKTAA